METINWNYLLSHQSEFIRIDEQLRLLQIQLSKFRDCQERVQSSDYWIDTANQEHILHMKTIKSFRCVINLFGCHIFNEEILSREQSLESQIQDEFDRFQKVDNYATDSEEIFAKLYLIISDRKNTEKIYQRFLVTIFDGYINYNNKYFVMEDDYEKEKIMKEIISGIVN